MSDWKEALKAATEASSDVFEFINEVREYIHDELTPNTEQPVDFVRWVPVEQVQANDYNPNSVAGTEMQLLYRSIKNDGYTQPIVTIWDDALEKYVIIDGFHRYFTCKSNADIQEWTNGKLPVVVLKKEINERMAATVRHNRARGSHSVGGMSNMVFKMLDNGWSDEHIFNHLGMDADELLRLKHITGFSKLFENAEYNRAWVTKHQLALKKQIEQGADNDAGE